MGRLKTVNQNKKYIYAATGVALIMIIFYSFILIPSAEKSDLRNYVKNHDLSVGSQDIGGYGQIFYEYNGKRTYITDHQKNHQSPVASRQYVAWLEEAGGKYQVILYDLLKQRQLQLTFISSNSNISLDKGKVAWEGKQGDKAVVYYFNGQKVKRISSKYASVRPSVKDNRVLFAQQISNNLWQAVEYNDDNGEAEIITEGSEREAAWPRYQNNMVKTGI